MTKPDILKILDNLKLTIDPCAHDEAIMCVNGKPIGSSIPQVYAAPCIDRWWPALKAEIAEAVVEALGHGEQRPGCERCIYDFAIVDQGKCEQCESIHNHPHLDKPCFVNIKGLAHERPSECVPGKWRSMECSDAALRNALDDDAWGHCPCGGRSPLLTAWKGVAHGDE